MKNNGSEDVYIRSVIASYFQIYRKVIQFCLLITLSVRKIDHLPFIQLIFTYTHFSFPCRCSANGSARYWIAFGMETSNEGNGNDESKHVRLADLEEPNENSSTSSSSLESIYKRITNLTGQSPVKVELITDEEAKEQVSTSGC